MHYLFVSCICSVFFIASVLILYKKDKIKNGYIVIFNIIINIKKASVAGDFTLEPSENFNLSFLRSYFNDFVDFKRL